MKQLGDVLKSIRSAYHFKYSDLQEIVHIVDMDGAYIPDDDILEDPEAEKPIYSPTAIRSKNRLGIINRNTNKRSCLDRISATPSLAGIPYQVYYMSSNLDHVLYNKQNSTDMEKENDAYVFAEKYQHNLNDFLRFITESDFSVGGSYTESWDFIKQGRHSLERHTNLGICISRAISTRNSSEW